MFGLLGLTPGLFALFVVFGFMVGVFFGFFGMGGSFLVTPRCSSSDTLPRSRSGVR